MLLEGIEKHGLGNWKNIADYIGSKSAKQCDEHYWQDYMGTFGQCLPAQSMVGDAQVDTSSLAWPGAPPQNDFVIVPSPDMIGTSVAAVAHMSEDSDVLPTSTGKSIRESTGAAATRKEQEVREKLAQLTGAEIAGFMPLREDFDTEHNNDAEFLLVDMEFHPDDHPAEVEMKLKVVDIYNCKLDERDERKRFVIDRGLVDLRRLQQADKKRSKEDRELIGRLKMFSRMVSPEEADALVEGILTQRKLKRQIDAYKLYRSMGIRTIDQARKFETDRKKREYQLKAQKSRQSSSYLQASPSVSLSLQADDSDPSTGVSTDSPKEVLESTRNAPWADLLTEQELMLCQEVSLLPLQYVAIQEAIVREAYRNGMLTPEGFRRVIKVQGYEEVEESDIDAGGCAARAIRRRRLRDVADDTGKEQTSSDGIPKAVAERLFDFFVEHSVNGNKAQLQEKYSEFEQIAAKGAFSEIDDGESKTKKQKR